MGGGSAYLFSGPGLGSQSGNVAVVNQAGNYSVTATGANGCTATQNTVVASNIVVPTATLSASGTLTCAQNSITLTAGGGNMYSFGGPGVVSQSGNVAVVNVAGSYSVTAIGTNGCTAIQTTTVSSNTTSSPLSLTVNVPLSCSTSSVTLTATSGFSSYVFSSGASQQGGPGGNTATVNVAGVYGVTAINSSGCSSTATIAVNSQNCPPSVATPIGPQVGTINQAVSLTIPANTFTDAETPNNLTLSVSGLPSGLSFSAPATISGMPSTTVGSPFSVTVSATDPSGLSSSTSFQLTIRPASSSIYHYGSNPVKLLGCGS
ncbi:hypothetical protein IC229_30900 [Spirosoma sp. BT702]|uniref:Dystroglycan-type cadherin-like domain-containing protein n=2 Tax=Spirosoma profusum TaxID=2771354 RepID=A0A927AVA9_9BACT|nr:hypothetical protein [Spirosoma profusum]